jgi:hypothetical protein
MEPAETASFADGGLVNKHRVAGCHISFRRGAYVVPNVREHSVSEVGSRHFVMAHASAVEYKRTDTNFGRELRLTAKLLVTWGQFPRPSSYTRIVVLFRIFVFRLTDCCYAS